MKAKALVLNLDLLIQQACPHKIMHRQNNLDSIPIDLFNEIFSRLPTKSIGRCRCVSKILASRLGSEDFKQLFLTRSLNRQHLLFVVQLENHEWAFFSSPQPPQDPYEEKLVVTAEFLRKFPSFSLSQEEFMYTSGLLYCSGVEKDVEGMICNPSTGQYVILPQLQLKTKFSISILGFDPIEKQFKVLLMNDRVYSEWVNILTLGSGQMSWRTIQCPLVSPYLFDISKGVCINGVLYYLAHYYARFVIVCFNVRNETFKLINIEYMRTAFAHQLINHKGKLVMVYFNHVYDEGYSGYDAKYTELHIWFLEDVEKHEWSKYVYILPYKIQYLTFDLDIYVVGMTSTGEIVFSTLCTNSTLYSDSSCEPSYVYYFNPERNSVQTVTVQGFENHPHGKVHVFMDHVEDLNVYDIKELEKNFEDADDSLSDGEDDGEEDYFSDDDFSPQYGFVKGQIHQKSSKGSNKGKNKRKGKKNKSLLYKAQTMSQSSSSHLPAKTIWLS